jgi:hypothetical protein
MARDRSTRAAAQRRRYHRLRISGEDARRNSEAPESEPMEQPITSPDGDEAAGVEPAAPAAVRGVDFATGLTRALVESRQR